jgi:hypothetical protein
MYITRYLLLPLCLSLVASCNVKHIEKNSSQQTLSLRPSPLSLTSSREEITNSPTKSTFAICRLHAMNLVPNQTYTLEAVSLGRRSIYNVYKTDASGELVLKSNPEVSFNNSKIFLLNSSLKGIPVKFNLVSREGKQYATAKFVPFPIETTGRGGAKVSLESTDDLGLTFLFYLQDFKPYERVMFKSTFNGKIVSSIVTANEKGEFIGVLSHIKEAANPKQGSSNIQVIRTFETLNLEYEWGNQFPGTFPFFSWLK